MIRDGYRLYRDWRGDLVLDRIADGMVTTLVPSPEDRKREPGYYDTDFNPVELPTSQ